MNPNPVTWLIWSHRIVYSMIHGIVQIYNSSGMELDLIPFLSQLPFFMIRRVTCFSSFNLKPWTLVSINPQPEWLPPRMNELPVIGYPHYAWRTLGLPGGKHCKSLEGNVWQKAVSTSQKTILGRDQRFFTAILWKMDLGNVDTRKK